MSILSDNGRRVFALEISGCIYRYHSGGGTSGLQTIIASGVNYVDVEGIISVSAFSGNVDPSGGIGTYEPITVTLSINKKGGSSDAGVVFGRCGARSVTRVAKISQNVDREDVEVFVDTDLSSLSYPRLFHLGAETILATGATSTKLTPVGRAINNTPRQAHSIDLEGSYTPELYDEITIFRGRRAKLLCAHKYPDGSLSDWVEVLNGFIESTPAIEQGDAVSLSLVPMVALVDTIISDKGLNQTKLLQNYHYFDDCNNTLEYCMDLNTDPYAGFIYRPDLSGTITANTLTLLASSTTIIDDYDVTLQTGLDSSNINEDAAHARYPLIKASLGMLKPAYPTSITSGTNSDGQRIYTLALNAISGSATGANLKLMDVGLHAPPELKQFELSGLKEWPNVINDTLETSGPSSVAGLSGGVISWRLTEDNEIIASKLSDSDVTALLYLYNDSRALDEELGVVWLAKAFSSEGSSNTVENRVRLWYPIDLSTEDQPLYDDNRSHRDSGYIKRIEVTSSQPTTLDQVRDIAKAFYQLGDRRLTVEDSLGLPSSMQIIGGEIVTFDLIIQYYDINSQSIKEQVLQATHETIATFSSSNVGYYIHLYSGQNLRENISFGDWADSERSLITRGGRFNNERIGTALLKLLSSGGGSQLNSIYDVFSVGCNLKLTNIDEASFLAADAASPFTVSGQFAGVGTDVRAIIDSLLKLIGAVMIMKRSSSGSSEIALVPIGGDRAPNITQTINASDWLTDPPPTWDSYEDIVTQIKYEYDYDAREDQYSSEVFFNNQEAINRYSGERSQITISLAGVNSEQFGRGAGDVYAEFLPTSSRLFRLLSNPLRIWRGSIGTGQSALLDLGAYVQCSSPHLKGYSDSYGVTDGIGMIKGIRQELMNEGCDLEIISTGLQVVAWNATAEVESIDSATQVTIFEDLYSSDISDHTYFKAGDIVDYVPLGDHDNAIIGLEIQSIVGTFITFTSAHGITAIGGTLEPTTYANASTDHQNDAYLANSSDIINSNIDAMEFN